MEEKERKKIVRYFAEKKIIRKGLGVELVLKNIANIVFIKL